MKDLFNYLVESNQPIQQVCLSFDGEGENAKNWFENNKLVGKEGKIKLGNKGYIPLEMIKELYDFAKENNKPYPLVINYKNHAKKFVFRRWVGNEFGEVFEENFGIDLTHTGGPFQGLHNTNLKDDGSWFPSAEDYEILIAYAWNRDKGFFEGENPDVKNIEHVTGKKYEKDSKLEQLMVYYVKNQKSIDAIRDVLNENIHKSSGPLRKLDSCNVTDEWWKAGEYNLYSTKPSRVPKTDLITEDGKWKISLKKAGGSQLMSGYEREAEATLVVVAKSLNNETLVSQVKNLFKERWTSKITSDDKEERQVGKDKNRNLTKELRKIIDTNQDYKKAVMMEAASGKIKFGENSGGCANYVLVWDDIHKNNNQFLEIGTYVGSHTNNAEFTIAYKTANTTSSALRIITK